MDYVQILKRKISIYKRKGKHKEAKIVESCLLSYKRFIRKQGRSSKLKVKRDVKPKRDRMGRLFGSPP